ncbi:aromatic compound dioxygenase [Auriscalpium vulgare]|uniref:Aromatic compound dioxygenase n=1 Tax=Auriscalpium vulgare TaxID=40419 RepID=A0ACB8S017_9AGAM|nr:aromatic compound dioxygenase [Auriscalpium vulgare]
MSAEEPTVHAAVSNGIPAPEIPLPFPDRPEIITSNLLALTDLAPDPRTRLIFRNLITKMHEFITETSITTEEWMSAIQFLTRTGQTCTPLRQEVILLSDVLGVSALVDALNNPAVGSATESSVLGPFYTEDALDVEQGESIASEGKGEYMFVEGRVLATDGTPISNAAIETWETDANGYYDTQYSDRAAPDCRGRVHSDADGRFAYRAVVPVAYPIPGDGPVGDLLLLLRRHNIRPNHLHLMIDAPGYRKLTTAVYPEGDPYLSSDVVFGVKKSLVVKLTDVNDEAEARKRGFAKGSTFKLLNFDIVLVTEEEAEAAAKQRAQEAAHIAGARL